MSKIHYISVPEKEIKIEKVSKNIWILKNDYTIKVCYYKENDCKKSQFLTIKVPKGFITDLASIPPLAQKIFGLQRDNSNYKIPSIIHDYIYSKENKECISRELGDLIFRKLIRKTFAQNKFWQFMGFMFYYSVRLFGWKFYKK